MTDEWLLKLRGLLGIAAILGIAFVLSSDRKAVRPRVVLFGMGLQFVFALFVLKSDLGRRFFAGANAAIGGLLDLSQVGANFVFGALAPKAGEASPLGYLFFFQTLTTIVFFAALTAVLYHLGVMQLVVKGIAWVMQRTMRTSGAETLSAAANIFVGQVEAPLLVRPFLADLTRSELMAVMTGGFATVAGGVMAAYVGFLDDVKPDIAGHLMAASMMAAPAGLAIAKILIPETGAPRTADTMQVQVEKTSVNVIDAAAKGATDGMSLALGVAAMLIAFVSLLALLDVILGWAGGVVGLPQLSMALVMQYLFAPLAWLMGIEQGDVLTVGRLLGEKIVFTEFVAYVNLAKLGGEVSERTFTMTSYALCGFANFASIAIQVGGIGALAPNRRSDLARLGLRAMAAGFLTTCLTATVAGLIL